MILLWSVGLDLAEGRNPTSFTWVPAPLIDRLVRATAGSWQSQISREITIQIKPDETIDMEKKLVEARELAGERVPHGREVQVQRLPPARAVRSIRDRVGSVHDAHQVRTAS